MATPAERAVSYPIPFAVILRSPYGMITEDETKEERP